MDYLTSRGDTAVLIKCVNQSGMLQTFGNSSTNATLFLPTDKVANTCCIFYVACWVYVAWKPRALHGWMDG